MRKYLHVSLTAILESAAYPNKFFTLTILNAATVFVFFLIWRSILADKSEILGYTLPSLITYYTITYLAKYLTVSGQVAKILSEGIHAGKLSFFLIKPISFNSYAFIKTLTEKIIKSITPAIIVIFLTIFFNQFFLAPSITNFILFLISLIFASLINYFIYALIGACAFWIIKISGLRSILGRLIDILNGSLFPLDFLPATFTKFTYWLPFRSMHYLPVSLYINRTSATEGLPQIGIQIIWVIILYYLYKQVWKKGVKHYDAVGN